MSWDHKLSRHARGYGHKWDRLAKSILNRDKYLCQMCRRNGRVTPLKVKKYDHAVDHIKPKARGGTDDPNNLQSLCAPCHKIKSDNDENRGTGRMLREDGWKP